jgi:putative PIN family toxin of toxin-antitoxin system
VRRQAVLDANVLISGILGFDRLESRPSDVMRRAGSRAFDVVMSDYLLNEAGLVLGRPWFVRQGITERGLATLDQLRVVATIVPLPETLPRICRDPKDDAVIATAVLGGATVLVTGDEDLLVLNEVDGVRILDPAAFPALLDEDAAAEIATNDR